MKEQYDAIIIGGGHNGLTAALTVAKSNRSVLLLERRAVLGGIAAQETFHDGFRTTGLVHDTTNVRASVVSGLGLEKYDLELAKGRPDCLLLGKNGESVRLTNDAQATSREIAKYSAKDAEAYLAYRAFMDKIQPFISSLMDETPPDLVKLGTGDIWEFLKKAAGLKRMGNKTMMEFLKVAPMCVGDYFNESFETDFIKAGLSAPAIYHSYTGPWSPYTMVNLILWESAAQHHVVKGPQALISAMEKAAGVAGIDILTDSEVSEILLDSNHQVSGVQLQDGVSVKSPIVMSSCTPEVTFYDLIKPSHLPYGLEYGIQHYRSRGTAAKVNLAIKGEVALNGVSDVSFVRTGNSFDEMEKAFDSVKYRQFSAEPVLDIHIPSLSDPTLAPEGSHVMAIMAHFAPFELEGGWNAQQSKAFGDRVVKALEHYAPGISDRIAHIEVVTPEDMHSTYNLTNGQVYHGEHAVDQLLTRPLPSCMRYATPLKGLFLCGSGAHPGGGITCAPGSLAGKEALKS